MTAAHHIVRNEHSGTVLVILVTVVILHQRAELKAKSGRAVAHGNVKSSQTQRQSPKHQMEHQEEEDYIERGKGDDDNNVLSQQHTA